MLLNLNDARKLAKTGQPLNIRLRRTADYVWDLELEDEEPIKKMNAKDRGDLLEQLNRCLLYHPSPVRVDGRELPKLAGPAPAAATAFRREDTGFRIHRKEWPVSRGQPALPPSLGIMAGGALLQGRGAGRTEYRFLEKGASPHWSLVWTMHVNPRWVLTWEETQSLTEEEFQLLRDEGRPPGRLREPMLQRAGQQRLEAADEGLLPERYGDPVHQAVIASTEWAGLPYGQGPAIAVHGVPVVIAGPQQDDGRVYGSLAVSASAALYRPGSLWAPVDPRHPGQPENGTPARMTDVQFETGLTTGHPPVMTTPQITLSAQVNGEGITLEAPFVITGDSLAELEVAYNPDLTGRAEIVSAIARALWEGGERIAKNVAEDEDAELRQQVEIMLANHEFRNDPATQDQRQSHPSR